MKMRLLSLVLLALPLAAAGRLPEPAECCKPAGPHCCPDRCCKASDHCCKGETPKPCPRSCDHKAEPAPKPAPKPTPKP
jgi:hypothetical protein